MVAETRQGICCCSSSKFTQAVACFQIVLYTSGLVASTIALALVGAKFEAIFSVITACLAMITVPFKMIQYIVTAVITKGANEATNFIIPDANNQVLDFRGMGQYWIPSLTVTLCFQFCGIIMGLVLLHGTNKRNSKYLTTWFIYAVHSFILSMIEVSMGDYLGLFQIIINSFAIWIVHISHNDIIGAEGQDLRPRKSQLQQSSSSVPLLK